MSNTKAIMCIVEAEQNSDIIKKAMARFYSLE